MRILDNRGSLVCQLDMQMGLATLTPPLRGSDLVPKASVVCSGTLVIAGSKYRETSNGMINLCTD
jgi:hypothetical protein